MNRRNEHATVPKLMEQFFWRGRLVEFLKEHPTMPWDDFTKSGLKTIKEMAKLGWAYTDTISSADGTVGLRRLFSEIGLPVNAHVTENDSTFEFIFTEEFDAYPYWVIAAEVNTIGKDGEKIISAVCELIDSKKGLLGAVRKNEVILGLDKFVDVCERTYEMLVGRGPSEDLVYHEYTDRLNQIFRMIEIPYKVSYEKTMGKWYGTFTPTTEENTQRSGDQI